MGAQSGGTSQESEQESHIIGREHILKPMADSRAVMKGMISVVHQDRQITNLRQGRELERAIDGGAATGHPAPDRFSSSQRLLYTLYRFEGEHKCQQIFPQNII